MPQSPLENVVSHWHKLIENFQTSSKDFYTSVEVALDRRHIPGLKTSRVHWNEGGILSPEREYLRVSGDRHSFDVCAAPFGDGFFFSSWMTKKKPKLVLLTFLLLVAVALALSGLFMWVFAHVWRADFGPFGFLFANPIVTTVLVPFVMFFVTVWLVAMTARAGNSGLELSVLAIPVIGWIYERLFAPETYYRIDTMLMFQSAAQATMMEVINGLLTAKGLRALNEGEEKPILQQLVDKKHSIPDEVLAAVH